MADPEKSYRRVPIRDANVGRYQRSGGCSSCVLVCVVSPNGCGGFDGDDKEREERGFTSTRSQADESVASTSSGVFPASLPRTLFSHLTAATPIRREEVFFLPSIKITHVNILDRPIVHADSIY